MNSARDEERNAKLVQNCHYHSTNHCMNASQTELFTFRLKQSVIVGGSRPIVSLYLKIRQWETGDTSGRMKKEHHYDQVSEQHILLASSSTDGAS